MASTDLVHCLHHCAFEIRFWANPFLAEEASIAGNPVLVSGSDDGSIDLWHYDLNSLKLVHVEGKAAHDHIVIPTSWCTTVVSQ